jgi:Protein of unknown function (DUF3405).
MNQAILFLSDKSSEPIIRQFKKLVNDGEGYADAFLLYHQKEEQLPSSIETHNHFVFTNDILWELGYKPIEGTLVPGSNHFPLLKFYLQNPQYDYYWNIEDDVRFYGNWSYLFDFYKDNDADLITCHIQPFRENTGWYWWHTLNVGDHSISIDQVVKSFNPIYRISNRALALLHKSLTNGWSGHHEVVMPTLFYASGFPIADFGGNGRFAPDGMKNAFYTNNSMSHVPIQMGDVQNRLYHPIKEY